MQIYNYNFRTENESYSENVHFWIFPFLLPYSFVMLRCFNHFNSLGRLELQFIISSVLKYTSIPIRPHRNNRADIFGKCSPHFIGQKIRNQWLWKRVTLIYYIEMPKLHGAVFANFVSTKMNVEYFLNYGHTQLHTDSHPRSHTHSDSYIHKSTTNHLSNKY